MTYQKLVESEMRVAVRRWVQAKNNAQALKDQGAPKAQRKAADRAEAVARGIVRGTARSLLLLYRPYERSDKQAVLHVEHKFGMPVEPPPVKRVAYGDSNHTEPEHTADSDE